MGNQELQKEIIYILNKHISGVKPYQILEAAADISRINGEVVYLISDEFNITKNWYVGQPWINRKSQGFGVYKTYEEAEQVRDALIKTIKDLK